MAERARASLASLQAAGGRRSEAEATLRPLIDSPSTDHHVSYRIATTYAQLGNPAEAVAPASRGNRLPVLPVVHEGSAASIRRASTGRSGR
jgi:CTP:molybdopterin cytidylyltransferase MocA